ncbi:uncharacterized protein K02A2.6-like [Eupeodes corollae]|uniref:uncharacterized protein K02A2.6-like n=1 Tax=Eupeodes corollae TaxID=290404 RepID=UPI00248FC01A|nr:uncharacterized protein K02A2.6-like [Eupeodes corollae]
MDFTKPHSLSLDGNLKENWKRFKLQFDIYSTATKTNKEDAEVLVARLLSCAGREAIELFQTFNMTEADRKVPTKVVEQFEKYCNPRTNIVYERYVFYKRAQKEGEPFDHFLKDIATLVENCGFDGHKDDMLRDRIVIGIINQNTQTQLLKIENLTLEKAIETCRIAETTMEQSKVMQRTSEDPKSEIHANSHSNKFVQRRVHQPSGNNNRYNTGSGNICKYCNLSHVRGLESCVKLGLISRVNSVEPKSSVLRDFIEKNKDVFMGQGRFPDKCALELDSSTCPVSKPPRRIPLSIRAKVYDTLKKMEQKNIITKVETPSDWSHNMVIVEKGDKSIRICLDPRDLNVGLKQEHHLIPKIEDFIFKMQGMKFFSILDFKEGFWQLELNEESKNLTVFSTPFGTYRYEVLPFGIKTAPEKFQKLNDKYFRNLPGVFGYIDDLIIGGKTLLEHDKNLDRVLQRAREINIKFNEKKVQYRVEKVKYLGHIFSSEGISPDPKRIESIRHIQTPSNKNDLQKILGTINYLRSFIPNLAELSAPMRDLLKKENIFRWSPAHEKALNDIKNAIVNASTLRSFDPDLPIIIQTDASQNGLGCCLLQEGRPVSFASKSMTKTETSYAQIEKEFLAIVYGCQKFHDYIYGRHITIHTDHKPLVSIINRSLEKTYSVRLQRMKVKLFKYDLEIKYVPGKDLHIADLLSRNSQPDYEINLENILTDVVHSVSMSDPKKIQYQEHTTQDEILSNLIELMNKGWPNSKNKLPDHMKFYWNIKDKICFEDGLVFYEDRIFVPKTLKNETLKALHENHFGITKTISRAKTLFYWPTMAQDIENMIYRCPICEKFRSSNIKQSLHPHEIPEYPYQKVGCDILEFEGKSFLVVIDYFSRWFDLKKLPNKTAKSVVNILKEIFATHGIPEMVVCDNQPFNSFECHNFENDWGLKFNYSSPRYPRSNGLAEKAVDIAKTMMRKSKESNKDINIFLLEYRTTIIPSLGYTPSQLLNSKLLKTKHPVAKSLLIPKTVPFEVRDKMSLIKEKQQNWYNKNSRNYEFSLTKGDNVVYRRDGRWEPAKIVGAAESPRSYLIRNEYNQILRRNSLHLRKSYNEPQFKPPEDSVTEDKIETQIETPKQPTLSQPIEKPTTSSTNNHKQHHYITRYGRKCVKPDLYKP